MAALRENGREGIDLHMISQQVMKRKQRITVLPFSCSLLYFPSPVTSRLWWQTCDQVKWRKEEETRSCCLLPPPKWLHCYYLLFAAWLDYGDALKRTAKTANKTFTFWQTASPNIKLISIEKEGKHQKEKKTTAAVLKNWLSSKWHQLNDE